MLEPVNKRITFKQICRILNKYSTNPPDEKKFVKKFYNPIENL